MKYLPSKKIAYQKYTENILKIYRISRIFK
jgi:hypothetical protein